jgi:hypothetical protein
MVQRKLVASKKLLSTLMLFGIVIMLVAAWLWYTRLYLNNERRFWMAVDNSLATTSVTKVVKSEDTFQTSDNRQRLHFASTMQNESRTYLSQGDEQNKSQVVTNTLVRPDDFYVQYESISTTEKASDGSDIDFGNLNGVWARQDNSPETLEAVKNNYVGSIINLIPNGNLPKDLRSQLINELRSSGAYKTDYKNASDKVIDGRPTLSYDLVIDKKKYATALNNFYKQTRFGEIADINPENFVEEDVIRVTVVIDKWSNRITSVGTIGGEEKYGGYGITTIQALPKDTISLTELQTRLQSVQ